MHLDIDGTGGVFMTSLWQLKRFEARISLFKSLDCPLALAAAGMNQRFTRYPPVINHNLGWCNWDSNVFHNKLQSCHFSMGLSAFTCFMHEQLIRFYLHGSCGAIKICSMLIITLAGPKTTSNDLSNQRFHRSFWSMGFNTHCGLVTPYGVRDLGQHWLR